MTNTDSNHGIVGDVGNDGVASMPLVSVCIPLYNSGLYIREAIESVLAQTLTNWELIITDDGSDDGSSEMAQFYSDSRIRYLRNPSKLGPEGNWNRCVNEGRGKYLKLLCHDDRLHPECLARQVAVFENPMNQGVSLVACARRIIMPSGRKVLTRRWKRRDQRIQSEEAIKQVVRSGSNKIGEPGAVLFRAQDWKALRGFNSSLPYVIDLEFWFRLLARGDCYYLKYAFFDFRISSQSWSCRLSHKQSSQFQELIDLFSRSRDSRLPRLVLKQGKVRSQVNGLLRQLIYQWWLHGH